MILHLKKNQFLLLVWVMLASIVAGGFGKNLGVPYLFIDPEYLYKVSFTSFFIIGISLAGLTTAFNITSYIVDGQRMNFLGYMKKPFSRFSLNNSLIPLGFLLFYIVKIVRFQMHNPFKENLSVYILGLFLGFFTMTLLLYTYFWLTNKDIFKYVVCKVDEKLKENVPATRATAMSKLASAKKKQLAVNSFMDLDLRVKKAPRDNGFYDRETVLKVFDQNHFNLVVIEFLIFGLLLLLGIFSENPVFQIPAAASTILFLTIMVMLTGAFSFWFRGWSISLLIIIVLALNFLIRENVLSKKYHAFGLDYTKPPVEYNMNNIRQANNGTYFKQDSLATVEILETWRKKFPSEENPLMIFICTSGGGQRAALWAMTALQAADSLTQGQMMDHTMLITGASGGLIGASYFRELVLKKKLGEAVNPYSRTYLDKISRDNLNPIIFNLLVNDLFLGFQKVAYDQKSYSKDRGYAFEQQLNKNTEGVLDKKLVDYRYAEQQGLIPMIIMAPTIINDGRKLFISPHQVSYMNLSDANGTEIVRGLDFLRYFGGQDAEDLRFLSALRMSASFPYITPNVTLPSDPPIEIMDAGMSDNFGVSDAVSYLYVFRDWVHRNTSGVLFLSIRDSEKEYPIENRERKSLFDRFFSPISSFYNNFSNLQDINNDKTVEFAKQWFEGTVYEIDLTYDLKNAMGKERASLNWRLTSREKLSVMDNIRSPHNQAQLIQLKTLLDQPDLYISAARPR